MVENDLICSELCYDQIRIAKEVEQNFFDCVLEKGMNPETFELEQIRNFLHTDVLTHN